MTTSTAGGRRTAGGEAGFTLVEALIAILILVIGLIAIVNLFTVAMTTNVKASQMSAAAALASQQIEELKRVPFNALQLGGVTDPSCDPTVTVASHRQDVNIAGVGDMRTCWEVQPIAGDGQVVFIKVVSLGAGTGRHSHVEFSTFRSCTSTEAGCPPR